MLCLVPLCMRMCGGFQFDPGTKVLEVQLTYLRKVLLALGCNVRIHTH